MRSNKLIRGLLIFCIVIIWGVCNFHPYPKSEIEAFGFTKDYLKIANDTLEMGRYVVKLPNYLRFVDFSKLPAAIRAIGDGKSKVIAETQREPLYPLALALAKRVTDDYVSIVWLQLICLMLSLYLWGIFISSHYGLKMVVGFFLLMVFAPVPKLYVSILYPYAFQYLLITLGLLSLIHAVEKSKKLSYLIAGVCMGGAAYERGAYIALPICLFIAMICMASKLSIKRRFLIIFPVSMFVIVTPWLIRNFTLGVWGMNQMTGYTLGYSYGSASDNTQDEFAETYNIFVNSLGTDKGTTSFIESEVLAGKGTFPQVDKHVATLVIEKIIRHPDSAAITFGKNIAAFPARLIVLDFREFPLIASVPSGLFYQYFARRIFPPWADWIIYLLSLCGLFYGLRNLKTDTIIFGIFFLYTFIFSTTIVIFDPRYRGALDPVIYILFLQTIFMVNNRLRELIENIHRK